MYELSSDKRLERLWQWLVDDLGLDVSGLEPASSDASFRRYFRVRHAGGCDIAMDAPPDKENTLPFIRNAELFGQAGVHVPAIYRQNTELGFLLLEDLGSVPYLDALTADNADALYLAAMDSLFLLQTGPEPAACPLPAYDRALLARELGIFEEWFLDKLLGVVLPIGLRQELHEVLIVSALEQPAVCVHRDYHSRNLMLLADGKPGVIDFQDAVLGPISYDLVSLLRDCYIAWPGSRVEQWVADYYRRLQAAGMADFSLQRFQAWFDLMGLQRHLKAIGIFARLYLRDDKPGYLADIPRTMAYVAEVCGRYPALAEFDSFLRHQVLPVYPAKL